MDINSVKQAITTKKRSSTNRCGSPCNKKILCCTCNKYKEYKSKYSKEYFKRFPWVQTLFNIRRRCNAKDGDYVSKGIKNYLTIKDVKFLWFRDKAWLLKRKSIDRINSKKDYTIDNCRYIELVENSRRIDFSKKWKSVICTNEFGKLIKTFRSIRQGAIWIKKSHATLLYHIKNNTMCGGYKWKLGVKG